MCLPAALAVAGAASGLMSAYGANQQAQAQMDSAAQARDLQNQQLALQQKQIGDAAAQEAFERRRQTDRELGKFMAAAGASGLSGVSLGRQQAAIGVGEQLDLGVIATNLQNRQQQSGLQGLQIAQQFDSRVSAAEASSVGPVGAVLGIGSGAVQGFTSGLTIQSALDQRKGSTPKATGA